MRAIYIFLIGFIIHNVASQIIPLNYPNEQNIRYAGKSDFAFKSTPVQYPGDPVIGFAWKIFKGSKQPNDNENLVLSPILIQYLLSILETASAGETKIQFEQVIGRKSVENLKSYFTSPTKNVDLSVATGLFVERTKSQNLNDTFVRQVKELGSRVFLTDFLNKPEESRIEINKWASDATYGQIKNLLSPTYDLQGMELILTSAVYFHNSWKYKFNSIGSMPFYTNPNTKFNTEFMETHQWFNSDSNGEVTFIEIPYEGEDYSMVIIYPVKPLDIFIRNFDISDFEDLIKNLNKKTKLIKLQIPKFKINTKFSVVNALIKMGLVDLFTINNNLPYLSTNQFKITDIIQEAALNVDENGTIASAAMATLLLPLAATGSSSIKITINKPFLAVIVDKTKNAPLFISKINVID